ncbi:hypothetical protein FOA52_001972 [Chlamydomonas sp. UWO 241]|nr:hypothetical protein FOA52_001972 [Chlamydomonas sp. UWO 241]
MSGVVRGASYTTQSQAIQLANAMSIPARSLACEREQIKLPQPLDNKMGHFLLTVLGFYSQKSKMLHGGQELYAAIKEQVDDGAMVKAFGMDETVLFSTYTLLALHVWLIVNRLGARTDAESREFKQRFYVHFCIDVERRVHRAGVQVGVGKWLKQLETVFYSAGIQFDRVLNGESDQSFTDVVLVHFFGGDVTKKAQAALVAKYLQRELHCLQLTDDESILRGHIRFSREPFEPFRRQLGAAAAATAGPGKGQQTR